MDGIFEYPKIDPDDVIRQAWDATARRDTEAGLALWRRVRALLPERPEGYIWPIQLLWLSGRLDEADAMADAAFARFPDDPELLAQYAWIAMERRRWDEAISWWAALRQRAPDRADGYRWAARASWRSGRFAAAEAIATEARERFPDDPGVLAESAWVATHRGDWTAALARWNVVAARFPDRPDGPVGATQALRSLGRLDEADRYAADALRRFPDDPDLLRECCWIAIAREDWPEAEARLGAAREALAPGADAEAGLGPAERFIAERSRSRRGEPRRFAALARLERPDEVSFKHAEIIVAEK